MWSLPIEAAGAEGRGARHGNRPEGRQAGRQSHWEGGWQLPRGRRLREDPVSRLLPEIEALQGEAGMQERCRVALSQVRT